MNSHTRKLNADLMSMEYKKSDPIDLAEIKASVHVLKREDKTYNVDSLTVSVADKVIDCMENNCIDCANNKNKPFQCLKPAHFIRLNTELEV